MDQGSQTPPRLRETPVTPTADDHTATHPDDANPDEPLASGDPAVHHRTEVSAITRPPVGPEGPGPSTEPTTFVPFFGSVEGSGAPDERTTLFEMPGLVLDPPPIIQETFFAFWRKTMVFALIVVILGAVTAWEASTIPDRPARPVIVLATPAPGIPATTNAASETLLQASRALTRSDATALTSLIGPEGLTVAPYTGGIPESGYSVEDRTAFWVNVLAGAHCTALGWRTDSRGRPFLLTDGWRTRPLKLSPNSTLELSPLVALVFAQTETGWRLRWFLVDATGQLTQQARTIVWQPLPPG